MGYSIFKPKSSPNYHVEFINSEGVRTRLSLRMKDKQQALLEGPKAVEKYNAGLERGDGKRASYAMNYSVFKPKSSPNFAVEFTNCEGTKTRLSLKTKDKRQALLKASQVVEEYNEGLEQGHNKKSLKVVRLDRLFRETFTDKWSQLKDTKNVLQRTARTVELMENPIISDITSKEVLKLVSALRKNGCGPATINRYLAVLTTALRQAQYIYEYIDKIPMFPRQKEPKGRDRFISKEEEQKIIEAAPRQIIADLIAVLIDTGMRLSECLNLEPIDCNFITDEVTVWIQKGDLPRSIPMTDRVRETLERLSEKGCKAPFAGLDARQAHSAWDALRRRIKEPWVKDVTYHVLRHTCASRLEQAGVSLYIVKEILGHANITTTQRYAHLSKKTLRVAMNVLNSDPKVEDPKVEDPKVEDPRSSQEGQDVATVKSCRVIERGATGEVRETPRWKVLLQALQKIFI